MVLKQYIFVVCYLAKHRGSITFTLLIRFCSLYSPKFYEILKWIDVFILNLCKIMYSFSLKCNFVVIDKFSVPSPLGIYCSINSSRSRKVQKFLEEKKCEPVTPLCCLSPLFHLLNQLTSFHEILYESCAIIGHPSLILLHFLQSVRKYGRHTNLLGGSNTNTT
jgi:hypothetical protein